MRNDICCFACLGFLCDGGRCCAASATQPQPQPSSPLRLCVSLLCLCAIESKRVHAWAPPSPAHIGIGIGGPLIQIQIQDLQIPRSLPLSRLPVTRDHTSVPMTSPVHHRSLLVPRVLHCEDPTPPWPFTAIQALLPRFAPSLHLRQSLLACSLTYPRSLATGRSRIQSTIILTDIPQETRSRGRLDTDTLNAHRTALISGC